MSWELIFIILGALMMIFCMKGMFQGHGHGHGHCHGQGHGKMGHDHRHCSHHTDDDQNNKKNY